MPRFSELPSLDGSMRSMSEMLEKFPAKYASELSGAESEAWYFLLSDGKLIGGEELVNHYEMLGLTTEEIKDLDAVKKKFCLENKAVRICFSKGHLYVEIFEVEPNEAQWTAIGTLYSRGEVTVVWDIWVQAKQKWRHGEGSLPEFKRVFSARKKEGRIRKLAPRTQSPKLD